MLLGCKRVRLKAGVIDKTHHLSSFAGSGRDPGQPGGIFLCGPSKALRMSVWPIASHTRTPVGLRHLWRRLGGRGGIGDYSPEPKWTRWSTDHC